MVKKFLALGAAAVILGSVAWAEEGAKAPEPAQPDTAKKAEVEKKAEVKLADVRFCPMMGHPVGGKGAGKRVYKEYTLYFCCGGCAPAFDALSPEEKEKKFAVVLNKQQEADKKKLE